jgi:hypothetical protein
MRRQIREESDVMKTRVENGGIMEGRSCRDAACPFGRRHKNHGYARRAGKEL